MNTIDTIFLANCIVSSTVHEQEGWGLNAAAI